ncbi:MAG: hypothetical protein ACI9WU_001360 [Myxococcota bacterium]|jgi:hypothetical protein
MTRVYPALLAAFLLAAALPARSAEITHVIDAFDGDKPWDGVLGLRFVHLNRSSLVLREWICQADDNIDVRSGRNPLCPDGNQVVDTRQMGSTESMNVLNIDFRAGLYHDMEFYVTLPIVLGWSNTLTHDDGVGGSNSLVDTALRPSLFSLPYSSPNRVGMGDLTLGFKLAPFHESREPLYPSWVLGVEYVAPIAEARSAGGEGVGSGTHSLTLKTAISRRVLRWFEPYFEMHGTLRFPGGSGPFRNEVETQTLVSPGHSIGLQIGSEFHPWRTPTDDGQYVSIDLAFLADFTFEGREFTDLFDALGTSECHPENNCYQTVYTRGSDFGIDGTPRRTDGLTDVEQYGRFGIRTGVTYQPMQHFKVRVGFNYKHTTSHFLTFADAGKNLDGLGNVEHSNSLGLNEYNPFYNENYDDFGSRFRVDEDNAFEVMLSLEGQL